MAIIPVNSITDNLQTEINAANAGDILELTGTFDGNFTLPNTSGMGSGAKITIRSAGYASLPNGRVSPSDASNMAIVRTTNGSAVFTTATNAGWWVLDGLEITDDAGTANINMLLDFGSSNSGAHDMEFTRCYVHQKETGTNYERSAVRVMIFNGDGLVYKWNYIEDFIGYPYGSTEPHNSESLLVGFGSNILFEDNYSSVWYNHLFLGGGDTLPTHTATLSSASTTSATFSDVTGLAVGAFVRFSVVGTATLSNAGSSPTLTRLTGAAWVAADGNQNGNWGDSCLITSQADPTKFGITRLMSLTGDNVFTTQAANSSVASIPNGTVDYVIYQTAKVTNIAGSVITYDPNGTTNGIDYATNALNKTPSAAAWCSGDDGKIVDVTVQRNTLHNNPTFAHHLQSSLGRGCPKGLFEIKNVDRFTFEGNRITGYPAVAAFTAANQNGSAPWITVDNVIIRSNWFNPDTGYSACARSCILISDDNYLNTITPTSSVLITNNLITGGIRSLLEFKRGGTWTITHNTVVNNQASDSSYNVLITASELVPSLIFKDNIGNIVCYGIQNYPANYDSSSILNNVLIDVVVCTGGINANTYGTGSVLTPIITDYDDVGFFDADNDLYYLDPASDYKNAGSDGEDPGVDWGVLQAALGVVSGRNVRFHVGRRRRFMQ